ncbi:MAG: nuclear transport factor 2 family protein [Arachidicoccus sp.]|nr:nuclear transport factor 2 family protein [Arachidicoccus sp.]
MKKIILLAVLFYGSLSSTFSQKNIKDKQAILETMHMQQDAWNKGDVDAFMQGYWENDSLQFAGKEIVYGWQNTLERYKKSYPTKQTMGELEFSDIKIDLLSNTSAFVIGAWKITHDDKSTIGGHYTLLFKKINGKWLIVVDHTS